MKKGRRYFRKVIVRSTFACDVHSGVEPGVTPYPRRETGRAELPERALLVTKRAHDNTASDIWVTYFVARVKKEDENAEIHFKTCVSMQHFLRCFNTEIISSFAIMSLKY